MLTGFSDNKKMIFAFIFVFLTTMLNYFFNDGSFQAACICVSIGFALAFYFAYDKKMLLPITLGLFLSTIVSRILFVDEVLLSTILKSIGFTGVNLFIIIVFKQAAVAFDIINEVSLKSTIVFVTMSILLSIVGAALISVMTMFNEIQLDIVRVFIRFSTGLFLGLIIFGTTILSSFYYEKKIKLSIKSIIYSTILIVSFLIVASALFSNSISWFTYSEYAYVLIVFYILVSFLFSYRILVLINVLFVILYQYYFVKLGIIPEFSTLFFSVNLYLLILSTLASSVKMVLNELALKNDALIKSSQKLESLVYSTDSLLKLSDDILDPDVNVHEDYLSRIFKIACNIFDNYDYATCYIKEDPKVNFIAAVGYDTDILMSFNYLSDDIDYIDINNPIHISNEDKSLQSVLKNKYDEFHKHYPIMTEAIRFGIYIDEDTIGGISFDISKDSGKRFIREEFENLKSFQKLMNSFFSINYLNYKNISLKNDIVLSLIRTLELFDQYTGGHSEEVAFFSNEIAKRCGLDEQETHDIYWAGVVHDIGKVGIDSSIINKPTKLSLEEYELIKEHSIFGFEILNKAEDLKTIAILVKHHHEWWNGAGYPSGLKGDEIPMGSQIISICDAVSTMAKKRPYTLVKTSREIIEELEMYSGVQFSPEPTKHMIDFIKEGLLDDFYKK